MLDFYRTKENVIAWTETSMKESFEFRQVIMNSSKKSLQDNIHPLVWLFKLCHGGQNSFVPDTGKSIKALCPRYNVLLNGPFFRFLAEVFTIAHLFEHAIYVQT